MYTVAVWLFALYIVRQVWLAFDKPQYSPIFANLCWIWSVHVCVLIGFYVLLFCQKGKISKDDLPLLSFPFIYWLMNVLHTYGGWNIGDGVLNLLVICQFLLFSSKMKSDIFEAFYKIVQATNIVSLVVWLSYQLNIPIGFQVVPYYNKAEMGYTYAKWTIFAIFQGAPFHPETRLCGIFNEPGALGTICALLFIITFKYTKLWEKLLLLATGFCTYSLAFYILVFGFCMLYLCKKNWKYLFVALAMVCFFFMIPKINWGNEKLNYLASRLEIVDGHLAGDNRTTDEFDWKFEEIKETNDIYFGKGAGYYMGTGSLTYKTFIVQYGYIGFGFLIALLLGLFWYKTRNMDHWIFMVLFLLSLYQRPMLLSSILGPFLLFGGICWSDYKGKPGVA